LSGIITPMKIGFTTQVGDYKVATPVYEGPLDLLLQLIEHAELDITKLALAQVTDQYLSHLRDLQERAAEEVSAFLVIAARLLQIKSEALLPRPPVREAGEEDPGEALARQLLAYKRYKEIAGWMQLRESAGLHTYLRLAPPLKVQAKLDLSDFTLSDIVEAAHRVFSQADQRSPLGTVVTAPRITIREKISVIVNSLRKQSSLSFLTLLGKRRTRLDVVVTFLAMLELVKRRFIRAQQDNLFGDITLVPSETWDEDLEFELEFGE
jgi:segregation and condensation protein A